MKGKKFLIKIGAVLLLVVTIGSSIYIFNYKNHKEEAINLVKSQTSNINDKTNFDEAYSRYFQNLSYTYYKNHEGIEVVSVTGKRYFKNRDKICDVEINYFINRDNGSLQFNSAYIDGSKIDEVEVLKMKIIAFSTVDSTSL